MDKTLMTLLQDSFTILLSSVIFSTSSATVRCISYRRCGGMQLSLDTWGPPGIWCRSDHSLECPQTALHHSPRSVLTPLGPPGHGHYKDNIIVSYHCVSFRHSSCVNWEDGQTVPTGELNVSTAAYNRSILFSTERQEVTKQNCSGKSYDSLQNNKKQVWYFCQNWFFTRQNTRSIQSVFCIF